MKVTQVFTKEDCSKMGTTVFDTLEIVSDIDWHYFALSQLSTANDVSPSDLRKASMYHYRCIIKGKKKLGCDYSTDEKAHSELKKFKVSK